MIRIFDLIFDSFKETHPKTNPKTNPNPKLKKTKFIGLGLGFWLVLGFVLVVYSAGLKYR